MKRLKKNQKTNVSSVSWPDLKLKNKAQIRAKALGLSFSSYVNHLVLKDVLKGGDFLLTEEMRENGDEK